MILNDMETNLQDKYHADQTTALPYIIANVFDEDV